MRQCSWTCTPGGVLLSCPDLGSLSPLRCASGLGVDTEPLYAAGRTSMADLVDIVY